MIRYNWIIGVGCWLLLFSQAIAQGNPAEAVDLPIDRPLVVAYSQSGTQVAVGGLAPEQDGPTDGVVVLFDAASSKQQFLLRHSGTIKYDGGSTSSINMIHALAYSPDGKTLAVAAELGLKLWDPTNGKELATLAGYGINEKQRREEVISLAFSPDGKLLAATGDDNRLRMWDVPNRKVVREFQVGYGEQIEFSPAGTMLATAGHHNSAALWRVSDGKQFAEIHAELGVLHRVAIDPEGKLLAAVGEGGGKRWRIEQNAAGEWNFADEVRLAGHFMSAVRLVAFSPDGQLLATSGDDGAIVIYDAQTARVIATLLAGGPFAFSPAGKSLAVATWRTELLPNGMQRGGTRFAIWNTADVLDANRLAGQVKTAAMAMVQALTTPQPDRRMMQGLVTVLSGPESEVATPILVKALQSAEINEKQLLVYPLGRIAIHDPKARTALIEALRNAPTVDVRTTAAIMIAQLPVDVCQEAVPSLVEAALKDESPHVRSSAGRALKRIDPVAYRKAADQARARGKVAARIEQRDGSFFYQGRSLEEWIKRLSASYVPNEIFGRPTPDEPLAAIRAIGPDAVPVLVETLKTGEWPMRSAAAAGLGALGPQATSAVGSLLEVIALADAPKLDIAGAAADAVATILKGSQEPPAQLIALANLDDPAVRLSGARALAVLVPEHPRGVPVLKAALAAASLPQAMVPARVLGGFPVQSSVAWLGRVIADNDAPIGDRVRAAASLAQLGEKAMPVLPEMLAALSAPDRSLNQQATEAIQKIGPQAVPAVSAALRAATDEHIRQRLATALWGMGEAGRTSLKEYLRGAESESLWWAAVSGSWDMNTAMQYQMAAREALERAGQPVPARQSPFGANPPTGFSEMFQPPSVAWSVKLLADAETPRGLRLQATSTLMRAPKKELLPFLPTLLNAMTQEQDRTMISQLANAIQRVGPPAVPAVKIAIEQAQSDIVRRELLRALLGLGEGGQQEYSRMLQFNPEYKRLFGARRRTSEAKPQRKNSRELLPREQPALADTEKSNRLLQNIEFDVDVYLHSKRGQEIQGQVDTASNSFVIQSWSGPANDTWTPQAKELPLILFAFSADGKPYDVPDDWNGKFDGWAFLLPGERDLTTIQWNEGTPTDSWKAASFGWGGLRNSLGKVVTGKGTSDESKRFRYVPQDGNSTSDLSFDEVKIRPVPDPIHAQPPTEKKE